MNIITTEIEQASIIIDDVEYKIAENTIETREALRSALLAVNGQPRYKAWLAELNVLLGKNACKELFHSGKHENVDRIQMIHHAVVMEFEKNSFAIDNRQSDESMEQMNERLKPMTEFLSNLNKVTANDKKR